MDYQLNYAVLETLDLIGIALCAPHREAAVSIEPRELNGESETRWDLGLNPPSCLIEVKLNPTRDDILEWLRRATRQADDGRRTQFRLVFSRGGGPALTHISRAIRISQESQFRHEEFRKLLSLEQVETNDDVFRSLGDNPLLVLSRLKLHHVPEDVLESDLGFRARCIAGADGDRIREYLFTKFASAVPKRMRFNIHEVIEELVAIGIRLQNPPSMDLSDLTPDVIDVLVTLQACPCGIPLEALSVAQSLTADELQRHLADLVEGGLLAIQGDNYILRSRQASFTSVDSARVFANSLRALLDFIHRNGRTLKSRRQVQNAQKLAQLCAPTRPEIVARVFMKLEKHLKDLGDKHQVYDMAQLSIDAAHRASPKTEDETQGEAQALICGISWVFQRVNRLPEAQTTAEKSLNIGEQIHWERNSAYCKKCIGRLFRMQAEDSKNQSEKGNLIERSSANILEAIDRFSRHPEFGPNSQEIGDCFSLLGRTYLTGGRLAEADDAISKAYNLIHDLESKDYADLLILDGELHQTRGRFEQAENLYNNALSHGGDDVSDASEIRARGYFQRGLNRMNLSRKDAAAGDFAAAKRIWEQLGEQHSSARADWYLISSTSTVPPALGRKLEGLPYTIRVKAISIHRQRLGAVARQGSRRSDPGSAYWDHLVEDAAKIAAIEEREW